MIQTFADWLVYTVFGMSPESHWGSAVNFFFYDTIKITVLLFFISVIMSAINPVLLLFINSTVHRLCKGWHSVGRHFLIPYHIPACQ